LDLKDNPKSLDFFAPAKADFAQTIEKNPRHDMAFDMRGLVDEATGDWDQAIADFSQEAVLNPRSGYRLADAYCGRGNSYLKTKQYDLAAPDLEKSIYMNSMPDPCECDPYNSLMALYLTARKDYTKARAKAAHKWVAPEFLEQLKRAPAPQPTSM
jgi:tetratricopeptide (TPR) repeat protein